MTTSRRSPYAFTLIELMVVVTVIGVLVALLLPAVQAARESARKVACQSQLKQIGLALASYESMAGTLPPLNSFSPQTYLLPYLEQVPLYNAINFTDGIGAASYLNVTVKSLQLAVFLCPSDRGTPSVSSSWNNYYANLGTGYQASGLNGAFADNTTLRDFRDGLSQTATFSECVRGGPYPNRDVKGGVFMTPALTSSAQFDLFVTTCHGLEPATAPIIDVQKGSTWMFKILGSTLYNHVQPINDRTCMNGQEQFLGAWTAGSRHPGGCLTLFADGHASFLKETMSLQSWRALGTRDGNDIVSSPE